MVLLTPPITKATKEVVGEEPVDRVPDYVDIDRLLYPESYKLKCRSKLLDLGMDFMKTDVGDR